MSDTKLLKAIDNLDGALRGVVPDEHRVVLVAAVDALCNTLLDRITLLLNRREARALGVDEEGRDG